MVNSNDRLNVIGYFITQIVYH